MVIVEYNPEWRTWFQHLERVLKGQLQDLAVTIEHFGSTSIPGMWAKPVIDVVVVMKDYSVFPQVAESLGKLGYTHEGDKGIREREAFGYGRDKTVPHTDPTVEWMAHHLYVCPLNGREFWRFLLFRDYLRTHTEARDEYNRIKLAIINEIGNDNRPLYVDLKEKRATAYVEGVIAAAIGMEESRYGPRI